MIKLRHIISESIGDREFERDVTDIQSEVEQEWWNGQKHQSWRLVPAKDLIVVWNTFAKYGRVDEKKLDKIWDVIKECAIKIILNSDWWGHGIAELVGKDSEDEVTREDYERFALFMSDRSGSNLWRGTGDAPGGMGRYSDVSRHIYQLLTKCYQASTPEERLIAIDQLLNMIHGSGPMAKWFVEGGTSTLNKLRDFEVKGIHLTGKLSEAKKPRLGLCYELSGRYVSQHPKAILVHGRLINPFGKGHPELDHAWVEEGNEILDPVMDKRWPKDVYEGLFQAKIYKKYTFEEVLKLILRHEHWGPWDEVITENIADKNHEKIAKLFIYSVWRYMPKDDRFSPYQFSLWMDHTEYLQRMKERLANQLYPNDRDAGEKFYDRDVIPTLEKLEQKRYDRIAKSIDKTDPLFILKSIVRGKTYEGAKQSLYRTHLHSWYYKGGRIKDEDADSQFKRLFLHAMGETYYDVPTIERLPRLTDLHQPSDDKTEEIFVQQYSGFNNPTFNEKVKVWRGTNSPLNQIKAGDFVTFDRDYADSYARGKFKAVVQAILPSKDLRVYKMDIDDSEMIYWPEGHQIKKYTGQIPSFKEFWATWH